LLLSNNLSNSPSPFLYSANQKPVEIKPATITRIEVSTENLDKLKRMLQSKPFTEFNKVNIQRKIVGDCSICSEIPDYIVTRYYEGVTRIERYCSKCLDKTNIDKSEGEQK
jgi:hypothetical protein